LIFKLSSIARVSLITVFAASTAFADLRIGAHYWPTPNTSFLDGRSLAHFAQPTESGALQSALWGCVRNGGSRFHEGIDLKALSRDHRGEATDAIFAFDKGAIQYVNRDPSKSSYGRYIVIEHSHWMPGLVTIYAHLAQVPSRFAPGTNVSAGERIGTMGRSASYAIPKERAHLHFEIGLWLGPAFQKWYDVQDFDTPNDHGVYNGMNIIGFDVWAILNAIHDGKADSVNDYFATLSTAVSVRVWNASIPDLLRVSPELMVNTVLPADHAGWEIDLSASGVPLRFQALSTVDRSGLGITQLVFQNSRLLTGNSCISLVRSGKPSPRLNSLLRRLFID